MREEAVIAHKLPNDEGNRIRKLMTSFGTKSVSNSLQMEANCYYQNNSLAEQTLAAHSTPRPDRQYVKGTAGKMYPLNPSNGYISRFVEDFTGCLGCGSPQHRFRGCPQSADKDLREICWHELWAHIPSTRKKMFPHLLFLLTLPSYHVQTLTLLLGNSIKMPNDHVFLLYLLAFQIFRHLKNNDANFYQ